MIALTKTSETTSKISFSWAPVPGCVGYVFFADDKRVSNTWDPMKSAVTFSKTTGGRYRVDAVGVTDTGSWPQTAPPPPVSTAPWAGWRHEVTGTQPTLPDRHFAYSGDTVALTCYPDTPAWTSMNPPGQLVSVWLENGARSGEGVERTYETVVSFPADWQGTSGELNWLVEWHTNNGQLSCGIGVACDYPVDVTKPGVNPRWFFRPTGPQGQAPVWGPPIVPGRDYRVKAVVRWSSSAGRFRVYLDDVLVCDKSIATLWAGDTLAFGFYNYRLRVPFAATVKFTKPSIV